MAGPGVDALFERYLEARERGEAPDVAGYLDEAGDGREALGSLIDAYLRSAPIRAPTEEQLLTMRARVYGSTPLTEARTARGLRIDDVVDELERKLSIPKQLRARLRTAYQRLEGAQLEVGGVDARIWQVLTVFFGGLDVRRLAATIPKPAADADVVYARMELHEKLVLPSLAARAAEDAPDEPDVVDRLFYGAS